MDPEIKTVIVGGGKGCRAILELALEGRLQTISMKVLCVVDRPGEITASTWIVQVIPSNPAADTAMLVRKGK
ncbi:MAG TPA: hypothetical protein VM658_03950 [bacterium]|nr:hypothetical protein [bacterium]